MTSCEKEITTEELLNTPFYVYYSQVDRSMSKTLPYKFEDEVKAIPSKYDEFTIAPLNELYEAGYTFTYFGDEYKLRSAINVLPWCSEYDIPEGCAEMHSETALILFNSVTQEPYEMHYYGIQKEDTAQEALDTERVKAITLEFIETELNGKYKKNIDIDEYDVYVSYIPKPGYYWVEYNRIVNDVTVHKVRLNVGSSGKVTFWAALSVPDDDLLERIPNITEEQYAELALYHLNRAYKNCNDNFTIYDAEVESLRYGSIAYNSKTEDYLLHFELKYNLENGNGDNVGEERIHFAIPLNAE